MIYHKEITSLEQLPSFELREMDQRECIVGREQPLVAVKRSIAQSTKAYGFFLGDELLALWGWKEESLLSAQASLWLLSTTALDAHPMVFARESVSTVKMLLSRFNSVDAWVWRGYERAVRWLQWLGFRHTLREDNVMPQFLHMRKEA